MQHDIKIGRVIADEDGAPRVEFIDSTGNRVSALVYAKHIDTAKRQVGRRVYFWLDHKPYGPHIVSEIGFAVLELA